MGRNIKKINTGTRTFFILNILDIKICDKIIFLFFNTSINNFNTVIEEHNNRTKKKIVEATYIYLPIKSIQTSTKRNVETKETQITHHTEQQQRSLFF